MQEVILTRGVGNWLSPIISPQEEIYLKLMTEQRLRGFTTAHQFFDMGVAQGWEAFVLEQ